MKKILIVDDEKNIRSVIREYAEYAGYKIEEAEDEIDTIKFIKLMVEK